jgi:hypothetical protein
MEAKEGMGEACELSGVRTSWSGCRTGLPSAGPATLGPAH